MSLNGSIVEAAALAVPKAILTPALSQAEREQEAILRPSPTRALSCAVASSRDWRSG